MAAVSPAGPDPMMMTLRMSAVMGSLLRAPSGSALPPAQQAGEREDSAEDQMRRPDVPGQQHVEATQQRHEHEDEGGEADDRGGGAVHDDPRQPLKGLGR